MRLERKWMDLEGHRSYKISSVSFPAIERVREKGRSEGAYAWEVTHMQFLTWGFISESLETVGNEGLELSRDSKFRNISEKVICVEVGI